MKKAMIVMNPHAGKQKVQNNIYDVVDSLFLNGYAATVYATKAAGDATNIVMDKAGIYDMIVCCGGDGTLNEVISGMMQLEKKIPLGYIPAGTTNDLATSLSIPKNMAEAAQDLTSGRIFPFDIGRFNQDKYFTYVAAFGALSDISYTTSQKFKSVFGHVAYVIAALKTLLPAAVSLIPKYHARIEYDGKVIEDDFVFGAISNSTSMAGLFKMEDEDVGLNDGLFELLLIEHSRNPILLTLTMLEMMLKKYDRKGIHMLRAKNIKIISEEGLAWSLDGENGGVHKEAQILNINKGINFIVGEHVKGALGQ
ncbi:MAG: diacylglycerol/lipid kinase family protein [Bacillota bacterium]|jgi:diacylglycerol kinase (ATP)